MVITPVPAAPARREVNLLLAALPADCLARLQPTLEPISMSAGMVLHEQGQPQRYVYFPTDAIVSLQFVLESGHGSEIAVTGHEGMVGVSQFMGGGSTLSRAVVQRFGGAYRLATRDLVAEFERGGAASSLFLRYAQAFLTQVSQTAACNRHHSVEQRLCRWLLLNLDRLLGNDLAMTQELIAGLLGVRREGVTESALKLQAAGLIRYARGHIQIRDREGLERLSCECYGVVRNEYQRLLPACRAA